MLLVLIASIVYFILLFKFKDYRSELECYILKGNPQNMSDVERLQYEYSQKHTGEKTL